MANVNHKTTSKNRSLKVHDLDYFVKHKGGQISKTDIFIDYIDGVYTLTIELNDINGRLIVCDLKSTSRFSQKTLNSLCCENISIYEKMLDNFLSDSELGYSSLTDEKDFFEGIFSNIIKENLGISISQNSETYSDNETVTVSLSFKDEVISEDCFSIKIND